MKPFRFTLQPLRVIREQREQAALKRYSDALRACTEAAGQMQAASAELAAAWSALCQDLSQGVSASHLRRTRAWCGALEVRQKECAEALRAARHAADSTWNEAARASRDRKALERLRDKALRVHNRAVQRAEQVVLDEMAVRMAGSRGGLRFNNNSENQAT